VAALRRARDLRVVATLRDGRRSFRSVHRVQVQGWLTYCVRGGDIDRARLTRREYTPDPANSPPEVYLSVATWEFNRCHLSLLPGNRRGATYDRDGDRLRVDWMRDGRVLRADGFADPEREDQRLRAFETYVPADGRRHRISMKVTDERGAWASLTLKVESESSRRPLRRWP
jgi:hypothetical protein